MYLCFESSRTSSLLFPEAYDVRRSLRSCVLIRRQSDDVELQKAESEETNEQLTGKQACEQLTQDKSKEQGNGKCKDKLISANKKKFCKGVSKL